MSDFIQQVILSTCQYISLIILELFTPYTLYKNKYSRTDLAESSGHSVFTATVCDQTSLLDSSKDFGTVSHKQVEIV